MVSCLAAQGHGRHPFDSDLTFSGLNLTFPDFNLTFSDLNLTFSIFICSFERNFFGD